MTTATIKQGLSDMERAALAKIVEENGVAALIQYAAGVVAHEAQDTAWGVETRLALNKIAQAVRRAPSRF